MTIEPVHGNGQMYDAHSKIQKAKPDQAAVQTTVNKQGDTLTLSAEAKNLQPVVANLQSGFYNKPDVIKNVANKISQELPPAK
ncbi:MAG: hypothetical protein ABSG15_07085 [FCB group bacterium]|jgi:hypothetical protein